ncbi:hypothetical protein ABTL51_19935, partial [Acinetobacter baumannii]
ESDPPTAVKLARTPGERESRWMHLLCGEVTQTDMPQSSAGDETVAPSEFEALKAEQKRLADQVARLQALVERMAAELGISIDTSTL